MFRLKNKLYTKYSFFELYNEINRLSSKKQNSITINKLLDISRLPKEKTLSVSANYLYNELPIRLAKRIKDLELLPFDEPKNDIVHVRKWYIESFIDFSSYSKNDVDDNALFLQLVKTVYDRHSSTFIYMAKAIYNFKKSNKLCIDNVDELLNRFYSSRIGIRTLLSHYIYLNQEDKNNYFGVICLKTDIKKILEQAVQDAIYVAMRNNHETPECSISDNVDENLQFAYIPEHLYYILFEIIKNSISAVNRTENRIKTIKCEIYNDDHLVTIKVSDNGIGIKKDDLGKVFQYGYSTSRLDLSDHFENDFSKEMPLSGLGWGLSISRLYAEYFGGRIELFSEYGHGTTVYIHFKRNGNFDEMF
jgi:pyruvate dehydrogenase kinase 2/3/4